MPTSNFRSQIRKGLVEFALMCVLQARDKAYGLELLEALDAQGLAISEGTLYPLLNRLVKDGLLKSKWVTQNNTGHPRKYYELSKKGQDIHQGMAEEWELLRNAIRSLQKGGGA